MAVDTLSDPKQKVENFRVTKREEEGPVIDLAKVKSDEPIYIVRSNNAIFLYNLRDRKHKDLAKQNSLDY